MLYQREVVKTSVDMKPLARVCGAGNCSDALAALRFLIPEAMPAMVAERLLFSHAVTRSCHVMRISGKISDKTRVTFARTRYHAGLAKRQRCWREISSVGRSRQPTLQYMSAKVMEALYAAPGAAMTAGCCKTMSTGNVRRFLGGGLRMGVILG